MRVYTIRDIAQRAGVGISTVSRALNNRPDVGEETRQKVMVRVLDVDLERKRISLSMKKSD